MWAYAREGSAKEKMRLCYENVKADTIVWNNTILPERFSTEKMYKKFVEAMGEREFDVEDWLSSLDINEVE